MPVVSYVARPVQPEGWTGNVYSLDPDIDIETVPSLRMALLSRWEVEQIPHVDLEQMTLLHSGLERIRAMHASDRLYVPTTEMLIKKPTTLILGIEDVDGTLEEDRTAVFDLLRKTVGIKIAQTAFRFNVKIGRVYKLGPVRDKYDSKAFRHVVDSLNERALPTHIKLGKVAMGVAYHLDGNEVTI